MRLFATGHAETTSEQEIPRRVEGAVVRSADSGTPFGFQRASCPGIRHLEKVFVGIVEFAGATQAKRGSARIN